MGGRSGGSGGGGGGEPVGFYDPYVVQPRMYPTAYYPMSTAPHDDRMLWYAQAQMAGVSQGLPMGATSRHPGSVHLERSPPTRTSALLSSRQELGTIIKGPSGEERVMTTNPDTGAPITIKPIKSKQTQEERERLAAKKRVYDCPFCGHIFSCSSNLSRHKRVHTGVKP